MIIVSTSEFRNNLKKYLDLAIGEVVKVKNSSGIIFDVTMDKQMRFNPSPSNDPYFEDSRNLAEIIAAKREIAEGKATIKDLSDSELSSLFSI